MKKSMKFLVMIGVVLMLSGFTSPNPPGNGVKITTETVQVDGMIYRVFVGKSAYDNHMSIEVVNVTKDKLEVEKLKLEIAKLKK